MLGVGTTSFLHPFHGLQYILQLPGAGSEEEEECGLCSFAPPFQWIQLQFGVLQLGSSSGWEALSLNPILALGEIQAQLKAELCHLPLLST